ncbi:uncharacterized protein LOC144736555 [Lampetra planeri]
MYRSGASCTARRDESIAASPTINRLKMTASRTFCESRGTMVPRSTAIRLICTVLLACRLAKLTIQAGVKVLFASETSKLTINGELLIDGQPRLPVTFGATGIPLSKGTWPGIVIEAQTLNKTATIRHAEFLGCSTCVTVRSSDVDVDWVRVRRCTQYGFYLEDTSDDGHAFRISNTSVRDCSNGIYATGGEKGRFEIVSTVLMDNSEAGLCLQGMASTTVLTSRLVKNGAGIRANPGAGRVTIIACEFSRQQQIGLEMKNFESLLITNSTFDGNGQGCILMSGGIITLEGNIFVGNSYVGVFITVVVNLSLVNNIFENNGVQQNGACHVTHSDQATRGEILGNYFRRNGQITFQGGMKNVSVTRNVFYDNHANEYGVVQIGTNILFQNNTLVNNTAGTTAAALFVGSATAVLRFNVFSNPACPHELWYNAPYSAGELDARHNFWGVAEATTVEPRRIRARLFDFYDDLTKGIVQMAPFYRDSFFAVVVYGAGEAVSPNGFTGGAVRGVTLTLPRGDYTITENILVAPASALIMSAGTALTFKGRTGIRIEGKLLSGSSTEMGFANLSTDSDTWYGIVCSKCEEITLRKVEMSKFELFQVTDTNVSLTNVTLSDSQSGLKLSCDGTCLINITVESCTFAGVLGAAINVQGVYDCFLKVSNSSFVNVMGNALRYGEESRGQASIEISSCYFKSESKDNEIILINANMWSGYFYKVRIVDSVFKGGALGVTISMQRGNLEFSGNVLHGFYRSAIRTTIMQQATNFTIHNNTLTNNSGEHVAYMYSGIEFDDYAFNKNDVTNNSARTAVMISGFSPVLHYNLFENSEASWELSVPSPQGRQKINATMNWWGSNTAQSIAPRINDGSNIGVLLLPYLMSRDISNVLQQADKISTRNGTLSGVANIDTWIQYVDGGYEVVGDITVQEGATLTIEPGVELRFRDSLAMEVQGKICKEHTKCITFKRSRRQNAELSLLRTWVQILFLAAWG